MPAEVRSARNRFLLVRSAMRMRQMVGVVVPGANESSTIVMSDANLASLRSYLGTQTVAGTLNLRVAWPVLFRRTPEVRWEPSDPAYGRWCYRAKLAGMDVHVVDFPARPVNLIEVVADVHLRTHLSLQDGQRLLVELPASALRRPRADEWRRWCILAFTGSRFYPAARRIKRFVFRQA